MYFFPFSHSPVEQEKIIHWGFPKKWDTEKKLQDKIYYEIMKNFSVFFLYFYLFVLKFLIKFDFFARQFHEKIPDKALTWSWLEKNHKIWCVNIKDIAVPYAFFLAVEGRRGLNLWTSNSSPPQYAIILYWVAVLRDTRVILKIFKKCWVLLSDQ